ncbi:hypothetical protein FRC10_005982 [Ceratobasidium sp. 414]|nr:hypothetical protein FRC10_005982 [Ceratobasidium sp. 414]
MPPKRARRTPIEVGPAPPAPVAAHIQTVGVKRPGFGTAGRPITVLVNHFVCTIPTGTAYHYDDIDKGSFDGRSNGEIMSMLQDHLEPNLFNPKGAFDGKKNMFTTSRLALGNGDARAFQQGHHEQDNTVLTGLMALNVVLRHEMISRHTFNARAIFMPNGRSPVPMGLELWPGVFQSVRPAINSMHINIDTTTGIIFKPGPVIEHALAFLGRNQPAELGNLSPIHMSLNQAFFAARDFRALRSRLKGLKVTITYLQDNEPRSIMGLTNTGASETMFKKDDGQEISVVQHFQQAHRRTLAYPKLPCIDVSQHRINEQTNSVGANGSDGWVLKKGKLLPSLKPGYFDHSYFQRPEQRLAAIRSSFQALEYNSATVAQFGITVNPDPVECPARVLPAPTVMYDQPVVPNNGSWDLRNRKLWSPAEIKGWMLIIFEREKFFDDEAIQHTVDRLKQACIEKGIKGSDSKLLVERVSPQCDVEKTLGDLGGRFKATYGALPNLIIAIMPQSSGDIHPAVKRFGDVTAGVANQPLKADKCRKGNMQFFGNVCLKYGTQCLTFYDADPHVCRLNAKLGGINSVPAPDPESNFLSDPVNPTLVLGADVSHPAGHTEGRPSFAALVGSVDSKASVEGIIDFEEMAIYIIKRFQTYQVAMEKKKNPGPKRIIYYRDGVAEGQFQSILDNEFAALQRACDKCGLNPRPKITLVIVGKRHHTRTFPQDPNDRKQADAKSGNCLAGTVIDSVTSRAKAYIVLRLTKPSDADLICGRAKNHLPPGIELEFSDNGKMTEEEKEVILNRIRAVYKPTHLNLRGTM